MVSRFQSTRSAKFYVCCISLAIYIVLDYLFTLFYYFVKLTQSHSHFNKQLILAFTYVKAYIIAYTSKSCCKSINLTDSVYQYLFFHMHAHCTCQSTRVCVSTQIHMLQLTYAIHTHKSCMVIVFDKIYLVNMQRYFQTFSFIPSLISYKRIQ